MKSLKIIFTSAIVFFYSYSYGQQVYSTPGSHTWTVPECVTEVTVKVWGAGGGGGGASGRVRNSGGGEACAGAGGGGGGGFTMKTFSVTPGQTYTINVGAGGSGGTPTVQGGSGGQSSFGGHGENLTATGGNGGQSALADNSSYNESDVNSVGNGGIGGVGSGGTDNFTGGNGASGNIIGNFSTDRSGGGGGAAGPGGNGGDAPLPTGVQTPPGGIGQAPGGNGANGFIHNTNSNRSLTGGNGLIYGGGGSGALVHKEGYGSSALTASGGAGADGAVILEYVVPPMPTTPTITGPLTVCQGSNQAYSVALDPNATSYNWSYTGTGTITNNGNNSISLDNIQTSGTLTVESVGSCGSGPSTSINIVVIDPPILSGISGPAVVCENGSGSYSVTNIPGASYSWSYTGGGTIVNGNTNSITINNITSSGTLTVTATNSCGSDSETFNITVEINPAQPIIDIVDPTCDVDGSAEITNYNSGVTYVFNPTGPNFNSTTGDLENFNFGQAYTVVAESANGCTSPISSFTVEKKYTTPVAPIISIVDPTCDVDGSAVINNYDNGLTYTFNPFGPSINTLTGEITGVTFGQNYTVTAGNGACTSDPSTDFSVAEKYPKPDAPAINIVDPTCDVDGSAEITNYDSGVTYVFNPTGPNFNSTTGDLENFNFGQAYTVVAESANGCTSPISSLTVEEKYTTPAAPVVDVTPANCDGDGTATISGYDSNLTYNLTTGTGTIGGDGSITGDAGNYTITATENGCTSPETSFTIEAQLPTPAAPVVDVTPANCDGDGTATINGYDSNLTYNFTTGTGTIGGDGSITGDAGNYTITATENGCTSTETSFTIEAQLPTPAAPVVDVTSADCDGDGTATISGYDSNLTYNFTTGTGTIGADGSITGVAGNYTITATENGCTSPETSFTIEAQLPNPTISVNPINPSICGDDGALELTFTNVPDGDYTITYNGGTFDVTVTGGTATINTVAGSYQNMVINNGQCDSAPVDASLSDPNSPDDPVLDIGGALCERDGITIITNFGSYGPDVNFVFSPSGPYVDDTDNPGLIMDATIGVTYTVHVEENGCISNSFSFTNAEMLESPVAPQINVTDPTCTANGSAEITNYDTDYTYTFNPNDGIDVDSNGDIINAGFNTTYTVIATNNLGCDSEISSAFVVEEMLPTPTLTVNVTQPANCGDDGSIEVIVTNITDGIYDLTYEDAGGTPHNLPIEIIGGTGNLDLPAGEYNNITINNGDCNSTESINVNIQEPNAPATPTINTISAASCFADEQIEIANYDANVTYTITPSDVGINIDNNGVITGLTPGTLYDLSGVENGCNSGTISISIDEMLETPTITLTSDLAEICEEDSVTLTASGGETYTWDGLTDTSNEITVSPASTTTYEVTGFLSNGCSHTVQLQIVVNPKPDVQTNADHAICEGEETTILAINADSYVWDNGLGSGSTHVVSPTSTTTYEVIGTNAFGCIDTSNVTITVNPAPTIVIDGNLDICTGSSTTLTATGADSYIWDNGLGNGDQHTVSPGNTTTYQVIGIDAIGCKDTVQVTVNIHENPDISAGNNMQICLGDQTMISATGGSTYTWDNGLGSGEAHTVSPTTTTTYEVIGYDNYGCSDSATITITVSDIPEGLPASSYNACQGTNINLTIDGADSTLYTYYWYKDDVFVYSGSSYFIDGVNLTDAGTYNIVIENQTGCTSGTEITLAVNVCDIDIPEVISPNSDGKNDYFYIGNLDAYPNTEIWIYNRWGAEVYHSENYKNNWDGTSQNKLNVGGNELPEGTYYYILKLGGDDNVPNSGEVYTGYIYLKR